MKEFVECLTPEQKESFKNWYIWSDYALNKLVDNESDELTSENFKVIFIIPNDEPKIATVEDIVYYNPEDNDFDFYIGDDGDYFEREDTPEEVVEFLDKYLNKAQYK